MELLVTGGAGYIGSHVCHKLVAQGHRVTVIDDLTTGHRWAVPPAANFVRADVGDEAALAQIFARSSFDVILHFAASTAVEESIQDPISYYKNNFAASLALFSQATKGGVRQLIFSSTAAVYAESAGGGLIAEDAPLLPISPYGASKMMVERALQDLERSTGLRSVILRYFNAAGASRDLSNGQASSRSTHLIKVALEVAFADRKRIVVNGRDYATSDGTCERDFIHIEDLASAHLSALTYLTRGGPSDVFNIGYGKGHSVLEVLNTIEQVSGRKLTVEFGPRRPGDAAIVVSDNQKARRILHWEPEFDDLHLICETAYRWELKLRSRSENRGQSGGVD